MKYDVLVVGSGLFGSVFAYEASKRGKNVLVLEKREHIGGNCFTKKIDDINVHKYGAHIFRTSNVGVWNYLQQFCEFNHFVNSPVANYKGQLFNLPFNMNTFYQLWGEEATTPEKAQEMIEKTRVKNDMPSNLEEHILNLVGKDIYKKLVKEYTEKQWGVSCDKLPASIMRRIPLRFTFDNNYFNDPYQGIPKGGYTPIFEKLLEKCEVRLEVDYLKQRDKYDTLAKLVVYTGPIDAYFDYCFGELGYRSLRFEHERLALSNYQGVAVMNFTDKDTPFTRVIEHKHFEFGRQLTTVISREYPAEWKRGIEPYYPMEDAGNIARYKQYKKLAQGVHNVRFGGRLGEYKYYDMQDTILSALDKADKWL